MSHLKSTVATSLFVLASTCPFALMAQTYPVKVVRVLSHVGPGGPGDVAFRGLSQALSQSMGQPFVVETRLGAEGMIAGEACAKASPDGYTLCTGDSYSTVLNPLIRQKMPYDAARDLIPVAFIGYLPAAIEISAGVPADSLAQLFELAKAKPNTVAWGTFGNASSSHLYIEYVRNTKGIHFLNVPYKGAPAAWQALLGGQVQVVTYALGPALPMARAGKVKLLAVNTDQRLLSLPDVPTMREAGLDIPLVTWYGLFAPARVPTEIIRRLNAQTNSELVNKPGTAQEFLVKQGIEALPPAGGSTEVFAEFLQRERTKYANVVKVTGVTVE